MRLVIFTSVVHYQTGSIVAHAGFVKEVDIWARIFDEILIISVLGEGKEPADAIPYNSKLIKFSWLDHKQITTGFTGKITLLFKYPYWIFKSFRQLTKNDILMARGPDSIGFLGVILSKFTGLPRFAKYADQWKNFENEPTGYRIQKMFYRSKRFGGPVQIYGNSDPERPHLIPFFTSSVSLADWYESLPTIEERKFELPFRLLCVGRLVPAKGFDNVILAVKRVISSGYNVELEIAGDGPELKNLITESTNLGLTTRIHFSGMNNWDGLKAKYAHSHCFIHSSRKEGFGKVLVEAMTFGLPIIATDVGVTRSILNPPLCGTIVAPGNEKAIASAIIDVYEHYDVHIEMAKRAREKAIELVLEKVESQYRNFVAEYLLIERQ